MFTNYQTLPWQYAPNNNIPIIKKYNLSFNPNKDIVNVANIYEDILPNENNPTNNSFNTLKERYILNRYIRTIFLKTGDGENLLINGKENNTNQEVINLLSHVKLLGLNPYHYDKLTSNPFKTLPANFVMYQSCYPIRLKKFNSLECSKNSVSMGVRIYLLSKFDLNFFSSNEKYQSDIRRELDYYQFIKNDILNKLIVPNFIMMHSYYMTQNTGINFKKFKIFENELANKNFNIANINSDIRNQCYIDYLYNNIIVTIDDVINLIDHKLINNYNSILKTNYIIYYNNTDQILINAKNLFIQKFIEKDSILFESDKCLVMLTESPTYNIFDWATKTYTGIGINKKMIQSGYHDDNIWISMYFQLLMSLLVMFHKKIIFREFSLKNNVFIKDLNSNEQSIGVWLYIYKGINYYIPNYGYLLVIDSNFAELNNEDFKTKVLHTNNLEYKIYSEFMDNKIETIYEYWFDAMLSVCDSNEYKSTFRNYGGFPPSDDFLIKLDNFRKKIINIKSKYDLKKNIESNKKFYEEIDNLPIDFIKEFNYIFLHNRIGTLLYETEKNLLENIKKTPKIGDLIYHDYKICMCIQNNTFLISNDNKKTFEIDTITNYTCLNNFPDQIFDNDKKFNIIETYTVN